MTPAEAPTDPLLDDPPSGDETAAELDAAAEAAEVERQAHAAILAGAIADEPRRVFPLDVDPADVAEMHRLDLATRLLVGWTVGKPEAADEITIELAAMTIGMLDAALRRNTKEATP